MWKPAAKEELEYWWSKGIYHAIEASDNSDMWNKRKAQLEAYFAKYEGRKNPYTDEQKRAKKDIDRKLGDTYGAGNWHRDTSDHWFGMVTAELAMRQMMGYNPDGSPPTAEEPGQKGPCPCTACAKERNNPARPARTLLGRRSCVCPIPEPYKGTINHETFCRTCGLVIASTVRR